MNENLESLDALHDLLKIQNINILNKNFNFNLENPPTIGNPKFHIKIEDLVLPDEKTNTIVKTVLVSIIGNREPLFNLRVVYSFEIQKNSEYLFENSDHFEIQSSINKLLDHIIIATTRGIMYTELQGTFLANAILPLTKPSVAH
jgi:hypothetical protein